MKTDYEARFGELIPESAFPLHSGKFSAPTKLPKWWARSWKGPCMTPGMEIRRIQAFRTFCALRTQGKLDGQPEDEGCRESRAAVWAGVDGDPDHPAHEDFLKGAL